MDGTDEQSTEVVAETVATDATDTPEPVKVQGKRKRKPTQNVPTGPVADAQAFLGLLPTGRVDHAFKAAVRVFQREQGLAVNGRLDVPTSRSLGI